MRTTLIYKQSSPNIMHNVNVVGMLYYDEGNNSYTVYNDTLIRDGSKLYGYIFADENPARVTDRYQNTVGYIQTNGWILEGSRYAGYVTPDGVVCEDSSGYGSTDKYTLNIAGAVETGIDQTYAGAALLLLLKHASYVSTGSRGGSGVRPVPIEENILGKFITKLSNRGINRKSKDVFQNYWTEITSSDIIDVRNVNGYNCLVYPNNNASHTPIMMYVNDFYKKSTNSYVCNDGFITIVAQTEAEYRLMSNSSIAAVAREEWEKHSKYACADMVASGRKKVNIKQYISNTEAMRKPQNNGNRQTGNNNGNIIKIKKNDAAFCGYCGNRLTDSSFVFCPKCGKKIK